MANLSLPRETYLTVLLVALVYPRRWDVDHVRRIPEPEVVGGAEGGEVGRELVEVECGILIRVFLRRSGAENYLDLKAGHEQEVLEANAILGPVVVVEPDGPDCDLELVHMEKFACLRDLLENHVLLHGQRDYVG